MLEPQILYEDNHLIAVDKPHGMPAQGDVSGDESAFDWVKEYIRVSRNKQGNIYLALLHRIDRPTGGVMVFATTGKAAARMNELFKKRKIEKRYLALVERAPAAPHGELRHWLRKLEDKNIQKAYDKQVEGSKEAVLQYRVLNKGPKSALLEVLPVTGRQHQIRVQLMQLGCPIRGDLKYGAAAPNPDKSICLLAQEIRFIHPVKKEELVISAPEREDDWWRVG